MAFENISFKMYCRAFSIKLSLMEPPRGRVLVTGIESFVGSHVAHLLLSKSFAVRGTFKPTSPPSDAFLTSLPNAQNLSLSPLDLLDPVSIDKSVENCEYVLHMTAPNPLIFPQDPMRVIKPTMSGLRSLLEACLKHKVRRMVYLSSFTTVFVGNFDKAKVLDESFFADESKIDPVNSFERSRVYAEEELRLFIKEKGEQLPVVILNPSLIIGPLISSKFYPSLQTITKLMKGEFPGVVDFTVSLVDVRDVAEAVFRSIFFPDVVGKRVIISGKKMSMKEISDFLYKKFSKIGYNIPKFEIPSIMVHVAGLIGKEVQPILPYLGKSIEVSNQLSVTLLKMEYRNMEASIQDTVSSLMQFGFVPKLKGV